MTQEVKDLLRKIREKKIQNPTFLWETYYNKALDECMDECITQGKNERATNTVEENKRVRS